MTGIILVYRKKTQELCKSTVSESFFYKKGTPQQEFPGEKIPPDFDGVLFITLGKYRVARSRPVLTAHVITAGGNSSCFNSFKKQFAALEKTW